MSVDTPPDEKSLIPQPVALRREALLPSERGRGLGTVAVVCTMAGVASGLALATTLMAMQVADSMQVHQCPYRVVSAHQAEVTEVSAEHGYLGIRYLPQDGPVVIDHVLPGSPAAVAGLRAGDHLLEINGVPLAHRDDVHDRLYYSRPGTTITLSVEHAGAPEMLTPTLVAWPAPAAY